jgi:hypothetical protein
MIEHPDPAGQVATDLQLSLAHARIGSKSPPAGKARAVIPLLAARSLDQERDAFRTRSSIPAFGYRRPDLRVGAGGRYLFV